MSGQSLCSYIMSEFCMCKYLLENMKLSDLIECAGRVPASHFQE